MSEGVNGQIRNISFSEFFDTRERRRKKVFCSSRTQGLLVNAKWKRLEYGLGREDRTVLPISWVMNKNTMDSPLGQVFPNGTAQLIKSSHHYRVANDAKIVLLSRLTPPFSSHNPRRVSPRLIRDLVAPVAS